MSARRESPPANATGVSAPKISLLVVDNTEPQAFVMPSFIGQLLGSAMVTLQKAGFPAPRTVVAPPTIPVAPSAAAPSVGTSVVPGNPVPTVSANPPATETVIGAYPVPSSAAIIVSQVPAPGAKILAGSTVNFVVKD